MDCLATDNTYGHSLLVLKAHPTSVPVPNLVGYGYHLCIELYHWRGIE